MKVLIIGGVAGGASAAARLRRLDEQAEIVVYERGEYISYANCGLPYYIGGEITEKSDLTLQTPQSFWNRFRITVKTRHEAMLVEPNAKRVLIKNLETGDEFFDSYDKLVVSPGAKPILPKVGGLDDKRVFTLRSIPDAEKILNYVTEQKPKSAVVVGGGYIGLETAENLMRRGISVTVVELGSHVLGPFDADMAEDVQNFLRAKGMNLVLSNALKNIDTTGKTLRVGLQNGEIEADMAVVSVGVRPDTEFLANAVERTIRGAILVNSKMETSAADIYAVGDAVEVKDFATGENAYVPLAGPANRQGRIAATNIASGEDQYENTQGTAVLKLFEATAAATGINEKTAKALGLKYEKIYLWAASHATYYPDANNMSIKLLFDKENNKILGAQIFGKEGVDKRIDVLATAMRAGLTAPELADLELAYAPPFGSARDPVNVLGFMSENIVTGKVKQFYPEDIPSLNGRAATRLDVRTPAEVKRGIIPNTELFIPLDELRDRLEELDKSKPVYVNCQSGLRSYIACRILSENGYDCYNLAGGYRLYASIANNETFEEKTHACGIVRK